MTAKKKERKKNKKEKKRFVCLRCIYSKKIPECSLNEVGRGCQQMKHKAGAYFIAASGAKYLA